MTGPRRVGSDCAAAEQQHRRAVLSHLVADEAAVRVTNPRGGVWVGNIVGIADHPTIVLRLPDGRLKVLPQSFAVEEVPGNSGKARVYAAAARWRPGDTAQCTWCQALIRLQGAQDWAATAPDTRWPVLYCPGHPDAGEPEGDGLPLHEPAPPGS